MVKPPTQKAKLIISLMLFVLAFTTPFLCLLLLYLNYKDSPYVYNLEVGVRQYSIIWLPISMLIWFVVIIISPNIWLRLLSVICIIFSVRFIMIILASLT